MRDGQVVKGVRFREHRVVGEIVELAERYCLAGADELVFYDISASPEGRTVDRRWVKRVNSVLNIPFCVAGGIRSVADAEEVLNMGADKISVNSPALQDPDLISRLAKRFGTQCVVVGVDSRSENGEYNVYGMTGVPTKTRAANRSTLEWIVEAQSRGAGEIVLNCMNQDGVRQGYDCEQLAKAREVCEVPLVASGGAGREQDFLEVFSAARVDGALAASIFHSGETDIAELKRFLAANGVEIRPSSVNSDSATASGIQFLEQLDEVIRQRMVTRSPGSYVASLISAGDKRLAQKLGEEAVELALAAAAGGRDEQLEEAADLLFHLLVLLNAKGIRLDEVVALLARRHAANR